MKVYHKGVVNEDIVPSPLGYDITGVTVTIYFLKPDGTTTVTKTGSIVDATTGQVKYTTAAAGDLDTVGEWQCQVKVNISTTTIKYGPVETFQVEGNIV